MSQVRLQIDGQEVLAGIGESILSVAQGAGLGDRIPSLCYSECSKPEGGCRLCVVEVSGQLRPVAACSTPVRDGMQIVTNNDRIDALRREVLSLTVHAHPHAGTAAARGGRSAGEFQRLLHRYGIATAAAASRPHRVASPQAHPYLRFDPALCITCRRCLHVCEDVQGQFVFGIGERGGSVRLVFGAAEQFSESPCVSCGACVEVCPTGALFDVDRTSASLPVAVVRSVCGYCGVGCSVDVAADAGRVLRISGHTDAAVNKGHLCAKGRYAHGWARSPERLTRPLLREEDGFREITWPEAMRWAATRIGMIADTHGPDALGVLTSSRSTNEAAYLFQKLFRAVIGTNNVDCCARVCHSSTALALGQATGTGAASGSYADIEKATTIVIAGANPTEAHPVIGARIRQAVRRGARLVIIDPRTIELCALANLHLQIEPGTNVALFNAVARVMLDEDLCDLAYLEARAEGLAALQAFLAGVSVEEAAQVCRVPTEMIRATARLIGRQGPALFVTGLGLSELTQGTDSVLALTNIAMLSGSIGRPGAGMLPLRGQNNVQGNADMGSMPNMVTGYQPVSDAALRARLQPLWGQPPPATPGLTVPEMLAAARAGSLRGLWVQGEDIAQSDPHEASVIAALQRLDLLIVQELFFSETARFAHLILPAAGVLEQDGTFTNGERRIQRVRAAVPPPGEARADWEVARDCAREFGANWQYATPAEVMTEIAQVAPGLFGGVSYDRLEGDGLQWPCPGPGHPGTATVHADGFIRGKGRLSVVPYRPTPERRSVDYPYVLITGRVLQHYNVGTMTRRTPNLDLQRADYLIVHPDDAARENLGDASRAVIESRYGRTVLAVRRSSDVRPGTLFLSFHFPETHANALTSPLGDPQSRCPEYKVTAVRFGPAPARQGDLSQQDDCAVIALRTGSDQ
jgi:formate dehydrogenase alpha subunit